MKPKSLITPILTLIAGTPILAAQKQSQPNIIYILADDMGYGDLQSLNPDSKIPTPNMDKVVKEGVHFTDAHSNSSVSTPTRYGILTGRYAFRSSLKSGVLGGYSPALIEPTRETVATFLKANGYETACIGKWHLGMDWQRKDESKKIPDMDKLKSNPIDYDDNVDYSKKVVGGPSDHGFDYSLVIPASLDICPYVYVRNGVAVEEPIYYTSGKDQGKDGRGIFWRAGKVSPSFVFEKVLPTFIDTASNYIREHANNEKPYFLYLPLNAPHTPWLPTKEYIGKSGAGTYGDYVVMIDDLIGKVLKQVAETHTEENTLIIITSDNGSDWKPSDIEGTGHRANYIFKGRKADIYEAGHRIPFIAKWPGVIPAGLESNQIMCTTDLFATMAGLFNKSLNDNEAEDSYNLWPAFISNIKNPIREATIHHSLNGSFAIRKGNWKYTTILGSGGFSTPQKIVPKEGEAPATLYDIEKDPQELDNLYFKYPKVVKELTQLLEKYKEQGYSRPLLNK